MLDPSALSAHIPCMPTERTYWIISHRLPLFWQFNALHDDDSLLSEEPLAECALLTRKWMILPRLSEGCPPKTGSIDRLKGPVFSRMMNKKMTLLGKWQEKSKGKLGWMLIGASLNDCFEDQRVRERSHNQWHQELCAGELPKIQLNLM